MRVTPNCDTINSFFVSKCYGIQFFPDVAFGGGNYLVTWSDQRSGYYRIYCTRVSPSGQVDDTLGTQVGPISTDNQNYSAIAFTGSRFYVVWVNVATSGFYMGARFVEINGQPSDTFRLNSGVNAVTITRLAYDGSNFMLVWLEGDSLKGQRIAGSGNPTGSPFLIAAPVSSASADLCFDGSNYFVTWASGQIWGRKYDRNGNPVGGAFQVSSSTYGQTAPDVVVGANNRYFNVWCESRVSPDIYGNLDVAINGVVEEKGSGRSLIRLESSVVRDMVRIQGGRGIDLRLYDSSGRRVAASKAGYFRVSRLPAGIYFIEAPQQRWKVVSVH